MRPESTETDGNSGRRVPDLLRLWFTLREPIDRRTYLVHGVALVAFKYMVDAAAVWLVLGVFWTPLNYVSPLLGARAELLGAPLWFVGAMLAWSLPFLWIGVSMTLRRAIDSGRPPWLSLLFFVPLVNYFVMVLLCVSPSRGGPGVDRLPARPDIDERLRTAALGVAVGTGVALGMALFSTYVLEQYGAALFVGTPFLAGGAAAFIHNRRHARSLGSTVRVSAFTVVLAAGAVLLFGVEGAICIAMAAPLALVLAIMGAYLGRALALMRTARPSHAVMVAAALPLIATIEGLLVRSPLHEVVSSVEVAAPPAAVWEQVVGFGELEEPSELIFHLGIAYPVRARLEGAGVGAVRHCEFSTGSFVEPITVWEEPHRLSFDVAEQPPPLHEWSPYASLHPPHLDGYFRSKKGEFRLVPLEGGRTRLEGSTWYELRIYPGWYWRIWADALVHRIHWRVLEHVRKRAEASAETAD